MLVSIYTKKIVSVGKKLVDKLDEECTETVEETRLVEKLHLKMKISTNAVLARCTLCYFQ